MARVQKRKRKRGQKEYIGDINVASLGPQHLLNLSLVCPFCDEDSKVRAIYASYNNLLKDVDADRVIITPRKIFYPRECIMGHTFWSVEEVPSNYEKMLNEIEEIKEFTRNEMKEYRDSLEEAAIGYAITRNAKRRLERKKARAERERQKKEEARQRRLEEKERIRQAKLDGTYVPPERVIYPVIDVVKYPGKKGYSKVIPPDPEIEAERIRKRDEYLISTNPTSQTNIKYKKVQKMLAARGFDYDEATGKYVRREEK